MDNTDRRRRRKQQKVTLHDSEGDPFLYPTLSTSNFTCLRNLSWVRIMLLQILKAFLASIINLVPEIRLVVYFGEYL